MTDDIVTPAPEIPRDWMKRPLVVPPAGGKRIPYTRCTTFVSAAEDLFHVQQWDKRLTVVGLSQRRDLQLRVASIGHPGDDKAKKKELNEICAAAKDAAGGSEASALGTYLHGLTERIDAGTLDPTSPEYADHAASLDAYREAMAPLKVIDSEQFVVQDPLKVAGTYDRLVEYQGERYIADIKTGKTVELGIGKIAGQLAMYARSRPYDIATDTRGDAHGASTGRGLIIWLPANQPGRCELIWVDLAAGWEWVKTCRDVREKRGLKYAQLTSPFVPGEEVRPSLRLEKRDADQAADAEADRLAAIERQLLAAPSRDAALAVWEANGDVWTDHLTEVAQARVADLEAAS